MELREIISLVSELVTLVGLLITDLITFSKVFAGQRCLLRGEMLRIYYRHRDEKTIRQYEYENFISCYEAYKALKGNSFIDKVYDDVQEWEVVS